MSRRKYNDGFDNFRRVDRIVGFVLDEIKFLVCLALLLLVVALFFI